MQFLDYEFMTHIAENNTKFMPILLVPIQIPC